MQEYIEPILNYILDNILGFIGIIGCIYTYFRHNSRLNSQQKQINNFQIKQYQKEEENEQKALIKCHVDIQSKGSRKIWFVNSGKADARNVRIEILTSSNKFDLAYCGYEHWGPYNVINPQNSRSEKFINLSGVDTLDVQVIWDDDYQKNNTKEYSLQI